MRSSAPVFAPVCDLVQEHGVLLRQWAHAQSRMSEMAAAHTRRCAELKAQLMRQRARWVIATTRSLWGLGWPGLTRLPAAAPARQGERASPEQMPLRTVQEVLCQTGCVAQAHAWLDEESGDCRLSGQPCTRHKAGKGEKGDPAALDRSDERA